MTVGPMIILLPLHAPVQVAEEMATLDAITGGRSVLGVGQGYREEEFAAFGIDPRGAGWTPLRGPRSHQAAMDKG